MVFRNLNGSYSSVLELGTGQGTAKKIDASGDRSVRFTDKEGELVPLEAAQPEQENDVVTLQYLKDNALSLVGGSHYLEPMEVELSDAIKDDQSLVDGELIDDIGDLYPDAEKNDLVTVRITFVPSGTIRDVSYLYDGFSWDYYKTDLRDIPTAHGETPGTVFDSDDVKYENGKATVLHAANSDTVGDLETEDIITEDDAMTIEAIASIMDAGD